MSSSISQFDRVALEMGLSSEAQAKAWEKLRALRIGPEDPETVRVLLAVALAEETASFKTASGKLLTDARETVSASAKETAGNLTTAAAKVEKAAAAKLAAHQAEAITGISKAIAEGADRALARRVQLLSRNTLAAWVATVVVASVAIGYVGFRYGQANDEANINQVSTALHGQDGNVWLSLMSMNNAQNTVDMYCHDGSQNLHRVNGGTYCDMPLWLQRDGTVSTVAGAPAEAGSLIAAAAAWLAKFGPWWLIGFGILGTLLVRKVVRLLVAWPPIYWLLDLPPRPSAPEPAE